MNSITMGRWLQAAVNLGGDPRAEQFVSGQNGDTSVKASLLAGGRRGCGLGSRQGFNKPF